MLKGKHILLGITGSIAAYKAAYLIRLLVKEGAEVKVIMTEMAKQFITPLTIATLSKNPILVDFYNPENGDWNSHVSLGLWSDLYLIAPASANTMAKMATGTADNLLLTTYLSARCPVAIAPAMDLDMFMHPATRNNLRILETNGVSIIEPASGELASGLEGKGRMEEPEVIVKHIRRILHSQSAMKGKRVLITAGPTREAIDPVRFISNHSSGKMGISLAEEFAYRGAIVTVICGPVSKKIDNPFIRVINVESAQEMYEQTSKEYENGTDVAIFSAAVADFTPDTISNRKIKRNGDNLVLSLKPGVDIAQELGKRKHKDTIHIGFALETDNEEANAQEKIKKKNFDAIVLNSLRDKGAGFSHDTNKVTFITSEGKKHPFGLKPKSEVASDIADLTETNFF
ncbi:Coenzyme A biosynthesis bifunctional protein CoaBC [bioreactor metagenome]|uniref:Coenzyme A biosynthesis bifunctional protein CoaBC n=1 Tax=bioreactor metagenome TaxID=1076179 RepID=A0A644ZD13_9ZZZZ